MATAREDEIAGLDQTVTDCRDALQDAYDNLHVQLNKLGVDASTGGTTTMDAQISALLEDAREKMNFDYKMTKVGVLRCLIDMAQRARS